MHSRNNDKNTASPSADTNRSVRQASGKTNSDEEECSTFQNGTEDSRKTDDKSQSLNSIASSTSHSDEYQTELPKETHGGLTKHKNEIPTHPSTAESDEKLLTEESLNEVEPFLEKTDFRKEEKVSILHHSDTVDDDEDVHAHTVNVNKINSSIENTIEDYPNTKQEGESTNKVSPFLGNREMAAMPQKPSSSDDIRADMNIQVIRSKRGTPEVIQVSPKPTLESVPIQVVEEEVIRKGPGRLKVQVKRIRPNDEPAAVMEEKQPEASSHVKILGGITDVTEEYHKAEEKQISEEMEALGLSWSDESEDSISSYECPISENQEVEQLEHSSYRWLQRPSEKTFKSRQFSEELELPSTSRASRTGKVSETSRSSVIKDVSDRMRSIIFNEEKAPGMCRSSLMDAAPCREEWIEASTTGTLKIVYEEPEEEATTEDLDPAESLDEFLDTESCPCALCACSGIQKETPGTCNQIEEDVLKIESKEVDSGLVFEDPKGKTVHDCNLCERCLCYVCSCYETAYVAEQKNGTEEFILSRSTAVQTGVIYIIGDNEEMLDTGSNILQIINDTLIVFEVESVISESLEMQEDAESSSINVTINIRPTLVGQLGEQQITSEECFREVTLTTIWTQALSFQILLDENGNLRESISGLKERVTVQFLTESATIVEEWHANIPMACKTSTDIVQELIFMIPEILMTKGICQIEDFNVEVGGSLESISQDTEVPSIENRKSVHFPPDASIVTIISPSEADNTINIIKTSLSAIMEDVVVSIRGMNLELEEPDTSFGETGSRKQPEEESRSENASERKSESSTSEDQLKGHYKDEDGDVFYDALN